MKTKSNVKFATSLATSVLLFTSGAIASEVQTETTAEIQSSGTGVEVTGRISTGYLTGEAHEYLYQPSNTPYGGHKNSELVWKIDGMFMLGAGLTIKPRNWLTVNGDYWINITEGDGTMDNYDWFSLSPEWTHWSHYEDTDVTKGSLFDINADMRFFSNKNVSLSGIAGYKQDNFEWKAYGGDYIYSSGPDSLRDLHGSFPKGELGITYEQTFKVPYIGIGLNTKGKKFQFNGRLIYSALVTGEEVDHHHMRNLVGTGEYSGGSMIGLDVVGGYSLMDSLIFKAGYKYTSYDEESFDINWIENGGTEVLPDAGGMTNETSMLSMSLEYNF